MSKIVKLSIVCLFATAFILTAVFSPVSAADKLKVAIVLPGTITDESFNQTGYEGLKMIEKGLGAQIAYSERVASDL